MKGVCRVCGLEREVRMDGKVAAHSDPLRTGDVIERMCDGTGRYPE